MRYTPTGIPWCSRNEHRASWPPGPPAPWAPPGTGTPPPVTVFRPAPDAPTSTGAPQDLCRVFGASGASSGAAPPGSNPRWLPGRHLSRYRLRQNRRPRSWYRPGEAEVGGCGRGRYPRTHGRADGFSHVKENLQRSPPFFEKDKPSGLALIYVLVPSYTSC